ARDAYLSADPSADLPPRCRELLELERNALRMFTSCGWFFDDVGGIETIQVLRYAARAIDLAGDSQGGLEAELLERLGAARSNDQALGTAADLYRRARPHHFGAERAAAGFAAVSALRPEPARQQIGAYRVRPGPDGALWVRPRRTGREARRLALALDLLALEGRHIPFDAQTRFYRLMTEAPAGARQILRPLAARFGFAATALGEPRPE